jgi:diaminopimelate decarboxylase
MDHFLYRGQELYAEDVPLREVAAVHGTPCYVYSRATLERHWHAFDQAFGARPHLVCFAVKANANLAVLGVLARLGSGFDIVSVGELERVLAAGGDPRRVLFSGVGKRVDEMRRALEVGIRCFNVESTGELERLNRIAGGLGVRAPVALRVNPNVDARTHPYIATGLRESKFGIDIAEAPLVYRRAAEMAHLRVTGVDCHIGSQLTHTAPFLDALERVRELAQGLQAEGIPIDHLDLGGGLGIRYTDEEPPAPAEYARALEGRLTGLPYEVLVEPGRAIAGNAGVLLTRVEYLKETPHKRFAILDAAMNDLVRPALYQAVQEIVPVHRHSAAPLHSWDLVGPVCETGDFLGKQRRLALSEGDLLAVRGSGAYGFAMSSNYNSRPRAGEVLVDGRHMHLARRRETVAELFAGESVLPQEG